MKANCGPGALPCVSQFGRRLTVRAMIEVSSIALAGTVNAESAPAQTPHLGGGKDDEEDR